MSFSDRLVRERSKIGISQKILAWDLMLGSGTIGMYEVGERFPIRDTLYKMSLLFRVDPAWLAYGSLLSKQQVDVFRQRFLDAVKDMDRDELLVRGITYSEIEAMEEGNMPLREDVVEMLAEAAEIPIDDILDSSPEVQMMRSAATLSSDEMAKIVDYIDYVKSQRRPL